MKNWYDLTTVQSLRDFPWEATYKGLALSHKSVTTFYGDTHSVKYQETNKDWPDKNAWRWYNALKHGVEVEGFNVNLNWFAGEYWWARMHEPNLWKATHNLQHFSDMLKWISTSGIFKHTGRIVFFIQLSGQRSPDHTDFDPTKVPSHLRSPTEFLWLTPPDNPKKFTVGGEQVPWACWFNHFIPHGTEPLDKPQWSLRIDGAFTDEFREEHNL